MLSLDIPLVSYILLAVAVLAVAAAYFYGLRAYSRAARFSCPELPDNDPDSCPKASVIVYSQSDEDILEATVAAIMEQDYPDFEVVVVCDASASQAETISDKLTALYDNIHVTFVQPGSHNLSRRKLANTIGIKAAKGEVVVTTVANISIPSERWLRGLLAPFCGESGRHVDVSLGLSRIDFDEMRGPWKWYRQFDSVLTNALWVGYAAAGKPYRGDGYNLAFRRSVFFAHKGYAKTINLHNGDDDLFIDEISTGANTRVVVDGDSILTTEWGDSANRVWSIRKARYSFTARWLPKAPFVRSNVMMGLQWLVPASLVAGALLGLPSIWPAVAAVCVLLFFWGMEIFHYRRVAARFGAVRLWWGVVPFWFWRPVGDFFFRYDHRSSRKKNFTWQR